MNQINPKKLLLSKWTAVNPQKKEKHFLIIEVNFDDAGAVESCTMEAIANKRKIAVNWRDLKDSNDWKQGWKY